MSEDLKEEMKLKEEMQPRKNLWKRVNRWIITRKKAILVVLGWSTFVALITIKSYLFLYYVEQPWLLRQRLMFAPTGFLAWTPNLYAVDYLLIFVIGLVSGALLIDLARVFYGWITSVILSLAIPVIFVSLFIWFTLGAGEFYYIMEGSVDYVTWVEQVIYVSFLTVFRMTFPIVQLFSLLTVFVGAFLRSMIQPSAK